LKEFFKIIIQFAGKGLSRSSFRQIPIPGDSRDTIPVTPQSIRSGSSAESGFLNSMNEWLFDRIGYRQGKSKKGGRIIGRPNKSPGGNGSTKRKYFFLAKIPPPSNDFGL
jgi:hypothetical protein